jgi:hypothetical protein
MVKISGTDFTAGNEKTGRITETTGERQRAAASGTGHAGVPVKTLGPHQSAGPPISPRQAELHLARALGLPQDTLSTSIVSFARYFSLPLNPGLLAKIRRESLSSAPERSVSAKEALSPKNRENPPFKTAAALAAAASAAKGVELSPRGLEKYALFLSGQGAADPENPAKPPESQDQSPGGDGNSGGGFSDSGAGGGGNRREQAGGDRPAPLGEKNRTARAINAVDAVGADSLREKIIPIEEQDPLLNLLNRLPGKNGQRWIVIPFSLAGETGEFRVSLRILLRDTLSGGGPGRLALDVSGPGASPLRWLFVFDKPPEGEPRLQGRFWPPEDKKTLVSFQKELSRLLSLHLKQIDLRNDDDYPGFAVDCRDNVLPSVNKEV